MRKTRTGTVAVTLSVLAVALWLLSYSWLLGFVLPADVGAKVLSEEALARLGVSPWWLAEVAAVPSGLAGALLGLWALRRQDSRRRAVRLATGAGSVVALLSLASILA